jgi:hypothetical protein
MQKGKVLSDWDGGSFLMFVYSISGLMGFHPKRDNWMPKSSVCEKASGKHVDHGQ